MVEKINPILRWILFIPIGILAYVVFILLQQVSSFLYLGFPMGPYIGMITRDLFGLWVGLSIGIIIVPKGRIVVMSIITAVYLMFFGIITFLTIQDFAYFGSMPIIAGILNLVACISTLVGVIHKKGPYS